MGGQGATVGILMLESRFPRPPGDMGNPATWDFPVLWRVVPAASPKRVVRQRAEGLVERFIAAAHTLVRDGADGITTSCGFLALHQQRLAAAVPVPVLTSALCQVAAVDRLLPPGRRAGVLTISADSLSAAHLAAAGVPPGTPVGAPDPGGAFARAILGDLPEMDPQAARQENIAAARALARAHPELGAIVLECTNMSPFAADIAAATGLPCHAMPALVARFRAGLVPRRRAPQARQVKPEQ